MTASMRRAMRILGAAGLLAAAPASASARERPAWLTQAPTDSATHTYFVGQASDAPSLDAGRDEALKDAEAQAATYIGSRVTGRLLSRHSTLDNIISGEIQSSSQGHLRGVRVVDRFEEELRPDKRGGRPHVRVAVLLEYPLAEVRRERERLEHADRELAERQDALCLGMAQKLSAARPGASVRVDGFLESGSQQRRPFSRILEDGLRSCLSEKGVSVTAADRADLVVSGAFWQAGQVEVSAKAVDAGGRIVAARSIRISLDAVEPLWMTGDEDEENAFFSAPDAAAAARRAHGSISVRTEPRGAQIFVDGTLRGTTPADILGVEPGPRTVQLQLEAYVPASQEVLVQEDSRAMVRLVLRRKTGTMSIHSLPEGALIRLDGKPVGKTPADLDEVPTGTHEVALELRDHKPWSQSIEIEYQKAVTLDPTLTEEDGALSILVEPAGARLFLDGVHVGDSFAGRALLLKPVASGPHTVRAESDAHESREWPVRVRPRVTAPVTGTLGAADPEPFHAPKLSWPTMPDLPSLNRPDGMTYVNVVGAAFNGNYYNIRILEIAAYGFSSTLGLGTSVVEITRVGDWKTARTPAAVSYNGTSLPAASVGFGMASFFPIKLYLTPLAHSYHFGDNEFVASFQLYSSFCFWALPSIDGLPQDNSSQTVPTGSVMDFGALIHLGPMVGMRAGVVEAQFPKFSFEGDSYSGFHDQRFYVAADVSLGAFFPKR